MPLSGPSTEDLKKLHSEVNQVVNQRHLITTLAITIFGVIAAWLIPREPQQSGMPVGGFAFVGSLLMLTILFLLFLYSHLLKRMLRIFSTYLRVTAKSDWEDDWRKFRHEGSYWGYTKPQTVLFLALGVIAMCWPILISLAYSLRLEPLVFFFVTLIAGFAYVIAVSGMGFAEWGSCEGSSEERWKKLNASGS